MAAAAAEKETPKKNNSLRNFGGVNTQAARQAIGDDQFAWLENVQPIGFGNMPAVPGPSLSLANWAGSTAYQMKSVTLNGIDYEIEFNTDGSAKAVNLASNAVVVVATAGTFSGAGTVVAQWENLQAVIVDPANGYFTWDGTTLTKWNGTVQMLTVTNIGAGYTSQPAVGFSGGGGTGAAATVDLSLGLASIAAPGTGYAVGDILTMVGGTSTIAAQVVISQVDGGATGGVGAITGFNLETLGDYTAVPSNPVASTGGYGAGATFTLNWGLGPITVTNKGSGYTSAPTVTITGGGATRQGTVTAALSVVPSGGTAVATYAGRVWVAFNRTVVFSAPDAFNDFTLGNAGGSFIVVDEALHNTITALFPANNFLYIFGASSINVVADVSINSLGVTTFSNTNISASIGTSQPDSVIAYYRGVWFATPYGLYALYGTTTQKTSDDLDGIYTLLDPTFKVTAGTVVINKILCLVFLFKYNDPVLGARSIMALYFNKKWFFGSQGSTLTRLDTAIIAGTPTLYATDGTNIYTLYSSPNTVVMQTIITKLWDMGNPLVAKATQRLGIELLNTSVPQQITGTVDTEFLNGSVPFDITGGNEVSWINNLGATVAWENSASAIVEWIASGYSFSEENVQTSGHYIGISMSGTSAQQTYQAMHLQFIQRAQWGSPT